MSGEKGPLRNIAVFGQGDALWPVATLLEKALPEYIALILVEEEKAGPPSGAAALACDNPFFEMAGLNPEELVRRGNAVPGLGTDCIGWQGEGSRFFVAPSGTLPAINDIALHHIMLRAAIMHEGPERLAHLFQPLRFAARVALAGKFAARSDDPGSPLRMLGPTIQFSRADLGAHLKARFPSKRAQCRDGRPADVVMREDGAAIRAVRLGDGQEIAADLFVDVSGALARLAPDGRAPRAHSLADILPFDRMARRFDAGRRPDDHLHVAAHALPGGLRVETPLQDGIASEWLFSSAERDEAGPSFSFQPGFSETPWTGNIARLGAAAAQLGPYQSADMMLLLEQARHLVRTIPASRSMDIEATEFNRNQLGSVHQIVDFLALPFLLNRRDERLWADIRDAAPPEQLQIRLGQFKSRGRFVEFDHELFERQTWIETMIGFGIIPDRYDPSAAYLDMKRLPPVLKAMVDGFTKAIEAMPGHAAAGYLSHRDR